jgi:hypothetical protein
MGSRGAKARMRRRVSMPPMPGIFTSSSTTSKAAGAQQLQSLLAARGLGHLKAEFHERRAQRPADGRFIVDHKNANCWTGFIRNSFF